MKLFSSFILALVLFATAPRPLAAQQTSPVVGAAQYHDRWVEGVSDYESYPGLAKGSYKSFKKEGARSVQYADFVAFSLGLDYLDGQKGNGKKMKASQKDAEEWFDKVSAGYTPDRDLVAHVGYRFLGQGSPAVKLNAGQAERWLKIGSRDWGSYNLALAYLKGDIPGSTPEQAIEILKLSAKSSSLRGEASALLGQLYEEGVLVPKDLTLAKAYFDAAPVQVAEEEATQKTALQAKGEWDAHMAQMDAEHHQAMLGIWSTGLSNIAGALAGAPPASSSVPASQSAADTAGAGVATGSNYTGPNAIWVNKILATTVNYSCKPPRAPATPTKITCQRDGYVYQAQQLAWAAQCSSQTGHPDDAVKDAQTLVDTLKSAGSLCGAQAPTGKVTCDTDRIIACGQFPR
ncbi:MAG TPA: hypothetical protein VGB94_14410 [Acidobacteriaceae bacterium]